MTSNPVTTVATTGGTLFHLAARHLSSPLEWHRIAAANRLTDPWLAGLVTLRLPAPDPADAAGISRVAPGSRDVQ